MLLAELHAANRIDRSRAAIDSSHVRALKRGAFTGPSPIDRRKTGSKHHVVVDGVGHPLTVAVSAANTHDTSTLGEMVDAMPRVAGKPGRPRWRPEVMLADRGYDSQVNRNTLRTRWDRRDDLHQGFLNLARALICHRRLHSF